MFKSSKKKDKLQSTLKPINIIGIKSNMEYRLPMIIFTTLMTLVTLYSIVTIEIDSFRLLDDFAPNIYDKSFTEAQRRISNFTDSDIKQLYVTAALGSILICLVNGLKKHLIKSTTFIAGIYLAYFGWHYKYIVNGYIHIINKATYTVFTQSGQELENYNYRITPFEIVNVKLEMKYFLIAAILGTCFLLAYSSVNHCNPVLFTTCVCVYVSIPFICNTFVGEGFLVVAGVICILMFIIHIQGYSNFASKKIFAGFRNSIKIRGRYVSFSSFQQAAIFLAFTILVLGITSVFYDFEDYQKSKRVDDFGRNLIYSIQKKLSGNDFGSIGNSSNGLNNGDLKNMGDLHYTGEIMFDIKVSPSVNVAPLYLRSFTAADYSGERWTAIPRSVYKKYDFWDSFTLDSFYPQFCSGDSIEKILGYTDNYANISINSININPTIFLSEYRMVSNETEILRDASAEYDNEFSFNAFSSMKSYEQQAAIQNKINPKNIIADEGSLGGSLYDLLHNGDFYYEGESYNSYYSDEYYIFKNNEKGYRTFVLENYLDYPQNIENYLPSDFDSTIQDIYDSYSHKGYWENVYDGDDWIYTIDDYNYEYSGNYNESIVPYFYDDVIEYVREYIQSNTEYTLTPGEVPDGTELVEYFLNENHKGYCVHYATAATLMLRRAGIPARYVEGYFVSDENLNAGNYSGIPDSNAHAWTEVYYPIIGWQVVDCTPYYSEKQLPEENKINNDRDSDSATETDTESESDTETDIQTDTENDTDTSTEESISTDSDFSPSDDSDSIKEKAASQKEDSKFNNFLRVTINILFVILRIVIILALIVAIWFLIRFIVLKIRFAKFNSSDTRKGAKSMYLHSLFLLKIMGVTPKNSEGDREFAKRAVLNLEDIRTAEYENFTDIALNARFGKDSPSKDDISRMNDFIDELSKSVYNSSKLWKKLLIKYILFLK